MFKKGDKLVRVDKLGYKYPNKIYTFERYFGNDIKSTLILLNEELIYFKNIDIFITLSEYRKKKLEKLNVINIRS